MLRDLIAPSMRMTSEPWLSVIASSHAGLIAVPRHHKQTSLCQDTLASTVDRATECRSAQQPGNRLARTTTSTICHADYPCSTSRPLKVASIPDCCFQVSLMRQLSLTRDLQACVLSQNAARLMPLQTTTICFIDISAQHNEHRYLVHHRR
jgi:hypothetical protein